MLGHEKDGKTSANRVDVKRCPQKYKYMWFKTVSNSHQMVIFGICKPNYNTFTLMFENSSWWKLSLV